MEAKIYNQKGGDAGKISLPEKIIVELDEEKKYNKFLSSEILNLID